MKRILGVLLILLTIFSCLAGCEYFAPKHEHEFSLSYDETSHFQKCDCGEITDKAEHSLEWVVDREPTATENGYKHLECDCGFKSEEHTPILIEKNEDGTLKLDDKLIEALSEYLRDFYECYDIPDYDFGSKIELCKSNRNPILVEFGDMCYYVAAYYNAPHDLPEDFCCYDKYTWVGFERADEILERWEGKAFVAAFQINTAEFCKNIKTNESDYLMEHFAFFTPEFEDGKALSPEIKFENLFILLTESNEKVIYYSSKTVSHGVFSFDCIKLDGEYYIIQRHSSEWDDGNRKEEDLHAEYGELYDDIISLDFELYVEKKGTRTNYYAKFELEDIAKLMR